MKKLLKILLIPLFIILMRLVLSFVINEIIIYNYQRNRYNETLIKTLYLLNINQPYIVYYNEGNILYKNEEYNKAINKYEKALNKHPSKKRVCDIRINLSLAKIKNIKSYDQKEIYNLLEDAKTNLYENGCANKDDDNGSSQDAEKLEKEIQKLQDKINNNDESDNNNEEENEPNNEVDPSLEEILRELQRESAASRSSDLRNYENMSDYTFYSGKRW